MVTKEFLNTREAATFLSYSVPSLKLWRRAGGGPRFVKMRGRVLYPLVEMRAWLDEFGLRRHLADPEPEHVAFPAEVQIDRRGRERLRLLE